MKITRHRDRRTVDLPEAEAKWLIDHGFATKAKSDTSNKADDDKRVVAEPAGATSEEGRRRGRRASSAEPHPA